MKRKQWLWLLIGILLLIPSVVHAQNWSGILDSSRAIDWRNVGGVTFAIPSGSWTQCGSTIAAYSGSTAAINAAISACAPNHFVLLGAGTFTMSSGCIDWAGHSGVVLRGAGPLQTIVKFTGNGCGGYSGNTDVAMRATMNIFDQSGSTQPGASNALSLTGTTEGGAGVYPQGATHITVAGVGSDTPAVGTVLFIDQADDVATANGWLTCQQNGNPACSANGNNAGRLVNGVLHEQVQAVTITNISGSTYTISPGLYAPNWRSSQNLGAWWNFSSDLCKQCGIENLTLDHITSGASGGFVSAINIVDCNQCWLKNIRNIGSGGRNHVYLAQSAVGVVRDSYIEGSVGHTSGGGYGIDPVESNDWLIENNIFDQVPAPIVGENYGSFVIGYNFTWNNNPGGGMIEAFPSHDPGAYMVLLEGNYMNGISQDTQHGGGMAFTYFRNDFPGQQPVPVDINNGGTQNQSPFELQAFQHGANIIGNVLGMITCAGGAFAGRPADKNSQCTGGSATGPSYNTNYEASPNTGITSPCYTSIYVLGWVAGCTAVSGNFHSDNEVANELMRWGNYDTVHAAVQWNISEVPIIATLFLNVLSVPASHNLPPSFYYNSAPSWWQGSKLTSPPFPPIGPDVTGGNLAGLGGHAYEIPARLCYESTAQDSTNYPSTQIVAFDANNCYGTTVAVNPPAPPTNLTASVN